MQICMKMNSTWKHSSAPLESSECDAIVILVWSSMLGRLSADWFTDKSSVDTAAEVHGFFTGMTYLWVAHFWHCIALSCTTAYTQAAIWAVLSRRLAQWAARGAMSVACRLHGRLGIAALFYCFQHRLRANSYKYCSWKRDHSRNRHPVSCPWLEHVTICPAACPASLFHCNVS